MKLKQAKRFIAKQRKARRDAIKTLQNYLLTLPKETEACLPPQE